MAIPSRLACGACLLVLVAVSQPALGQTREYTKDGVTYRETRETIRRPVCEVCYEERERTVYRSTQETRMREVTQMVPITEYRCEQYCANRWNPFRKQHLAYRMVPTTRLETKTIECPVTCQRLVPEKRVERVPVVKRRIVEEQVIRRVALPRDGCRTVGAPAPGRLGALPAAPSRINETSIVVRPKSDEGGHRLASDPPRNNSGWRPAGGTRGRY